ncbi:hypothetical protein HK100_008148, partial [Physocladia obscura]
MFSAAQEINVLCLTSNNQESGSHIYSCSFSPVRQYLIIAAFLLHLCAVELIARRAEKFIEKNLDRVHYIAWLIWIKLGIPVGLLSSLIALLLMLRVTRSVEDDNIIPPADRDVTVRIISAAAFAISVVLAFVLTKLCVFIKELWIVVRIYLRMPDIENVFDYLPEEVDYDEEAEVSLNGFEERRLQDGQDHFHFVHG